MTVEVGEDHDLEPDAILRCGDPLPADATAIPDPLVVVEIPLLSTARSDLHRKLVDYFRLPTVQHYLVFAPDRPEVIHYRRSDIGPVHGVHTTGPLRLDPPGLTITLQDVYA
ncbi:Uma2 family endonuclease [Roseomonas sp. GCM10028921]